MAAKKKVAIAGGAGASIVAFALCDHFEGEGDEALSLTAGQQLELTPEDFEDLAGRDLVEKGVFVRMLTAIEGKRYSLAPGGTAWVAPKVYEAWKAAGYCEPTKDDPKVAEVLKGREAEARDAVAKRDDALKAHRDLQALYDGLRLEQEAARAQVLTVIAVASEIPESDAEPLAQLKEELQKLADMYPDQVQADEEPQLKLG